MSVRLYVGNLPKEVIEREKLQEMFANGDNSITTKLIKDRKTGKCRGFAFVTVPSDEMADSLIEKFNGQSFMESSLKIEKALPRNKAKTEEKPQLEAPKVNTGNAPSSGASGGSGSSGGASGASAKKKRSKRQNSQSHSSSSPATFSSGQSGSIQPDPRWAHQLAILKERLSAQTTNS
jgi:RNA recognition motif-containing protein